MFDSWLDGLYNELFYKHYVSNFCSTRISMEHFSNYLLTEENSNDTLLLQAGDCKDCSSVHDCLYMISHKVAKGRKRQLEENGAKCHQRMKTIERSQHFSQLYSQSRFQWVFHHCCRLPSQDWFRKVLNWLRSSEKIFNWIHFDAISYRNSSMISSFGCANHDNPQQNLVRHEKGSNLINIWSLVCRIIELFIKH